jgi:uncharacterized protein
MSLSASDIIRLLNLEHATCGFVYESCRSELQIPQAVLPTGYAGNHSLGNVLYFLVTPEASVQFHRIRSDQMYHHYLGEPLEVLLLYADGKSEVRLVGPDMAAGVRPQLFIPGGTFHSARVREGGQYALLGTSVWLRAEPADVEMGDPAKLAAAFPAATADIAAFSN